MYNCKQEEVINTWNQNLWVNASAGTGKTETLTARVINMIQQGNVRPQEILCITFTNKACKEMKERIEVVGGEVSKYITICTFHSWCYEILKKVAKQKTDIFIDFVIFDEEDAKELVKETKAILISSMRFGCGEDQLQKLIDFVKQCQILQRAIHNRDVSLEETINFILQSEQSKLREICTLKEGFNSYLYEFFKQEGTALIRTYNNLLSGNHGLDFNDLILYMQDLILDSKIVEVLRSTYKYVNIDEVQDTSLGEYWIIEKLFKGNIVLMCGDMNQTIYRWRGSEPYEIKKHFVEKYRPLEITFNINYRATRRLVITSEAYLKEAFPEKSKSLEKVKAAAPCEGNKVRFKINNNLHQEARYIYNQIKKYSREGTVCVLTRNNSYNIRLSEEFKKLQEWERQRQFEFILVDQYKFFRRSEIKDIIAFMRLIANRNDTISLKRILNKYGVGIGEATLKHLEALESGKEAIRLTDFIHEQTTGDYFEPLIEAYKNNQVVVFDVETTGVNVLSDEIVQLAAVRLNCKGKIINKFERLIKIKNTVGDSINVHHLSDEFLSQHGENKIQVLSAFKMFAKDSVIVGHNVRFDLNILQAELERVQLGELKYEGFYDTLDIYRRFYPNLINHKLETLSHIFMLPHESTHNALDDVIATSELLIRSLRDNIIPTSEARSVKMKQYRRSFEVIGARLINLFKKAKSLRTYELAEYIVKEFDIEKKYPEEKLENIYRFYEIITELEIKKRHPKESLLDLLKITSLSNGELEAMLIQRKGYILIPIITVHQSKGLEYDTVFIAGLQKDVFPSYFAKTKDKIEEERRLFYVAMTRARKKLYLTYQPEGPWGKFKEKSSLIDLIPREMLEIE